MDLAGTESEAVAVGSQVAVGTGQEVAAMLAADSEVASLAGAAKAAEARAEAGDKYRP